MFGWFAPETVTVVELETRNLTFLSQKARKAGKKCKVRLGPKRASVDVSVKLVCVRPAPQNRGYICVAQLDPALSARISTSIPQPEPEPDLALARRSPRYPISLRGRAREIPGFNAVTLDLSQRGARLLVRGPVEVGSTVSLDLELDVKTMEPRLSLTATTIWCRRGPHPDYTLGVEFDKGQPASLDLQRYLKALAYRLGSDLQYRTLADTELALQGKNVPA